MKRIILSAILLLCASTAFAHEEREYREHNEGQRQGHYRRVDYNQGYERRGDRWRPRQVTYRTEHRHVEPRFAIPLPPLPPFLIPPFIVFR